MPQKRKTIHEHFVEPENSGSLETRSGRGQSENTACGDVLQIDVEVVDQVIKRIVFQARACSAVIGTASLISSTVEGMSVADALALDIPQLVLDAGGVPRSKMHAIAVGERALKDALRQAGEASS